MLCSEHLKHSTVEHNYRKLVLTMPNIELFATVVMHSICGHFILIRVVSNAKYDKFGTYFVEEIPNASQLTNNYCIQLHPKLIINNMSGATIEKVSPKILMHNIISYLQINYY